MKSNNGSFVNKLVSVFYPQGLGVFIATGRVIGILVVPKIRKGVPNTQYIKLLQGLLASFLNLPPNSIIGEATVTGYQIINLLEILSQHCSLVFVPYIQHIMEGEKNKEIEIKVLKEK